jgi:hypothetical protein
LEAWTATGVAGTFTTIAGEVTTASVVNVTVKEPK